MDTQKAADEPKPAPTGKAPLVTLNSKPWVLNTIMMRREEQKCTFGKKCAEE
jgi:hypothetical protein